MKNSKELSAGSADRFSHMIEVDQREIDNPDPYRPACRNYMDRIGTLVGMVQKREAPGAEVAEIGSAQGNMSLMLAEAGYRVWAVDINPAFLDYSRRKYERGDLTWVHSNLEDFKPDRPLDAVILAEIIEHCAWPEKVIAKALEILKLGGFLIVTTPNAEKIGEHLPTFSNFKGDEKRRELEKMQFGPAGEDHLFLFTMGEMKGLAPKGAVLREWGYLGGSLVLNSRTHHLFRWMPVRFYSRLIRWLARVPLLNRFSFHNIYMVLQKSD